MVSRIHDVGLWLAAPRLTVSLAAGLPTGLPSSAYGKPGSPDRRPTVDSTCSCSRIPGYTSTSRICTICRWSVLSAAMMMMMITGNLCFSRSEHPLPRALHFPLAGSSRQSSSTLPPAPTMSLRHGGVHQCVPARQKLYALSGTVGLMAAGAAADSALCTEAFEH